MAKKTLSFPSQKSQQCSVPGCIKRVRHFDLCQRHYTQLRKYGTFIGNPARSNKDPNEFRVIGSQCQIDLYDRLGNYRATATVDAENFDLVKNKKWHLDDNSKGHRYVVSSEHPPERVYLHELVLGCKTTRGLQADHVNHDTLDNRKNNLRLCSEAENQYNKIGKKNTTSVFKGVFWFKLKRKWCATIGLNGRKIFLGYFHDENNAAMAYNAAAQFYYGPFALLNIIPVVADLGGQGEPPTG